MPVLSVQEGKMRRRSPRYAPVHLSPYPELLLCIPETDTDGYQNVAIARRIFVYEALAFIVFRRVMHQLGLLKTRRP